MRRELARKTSGGNATLGEVAIDKAAGNPVASLGVEQHCRVNDREGDGARTTARSA